MNKVSKSMPQNVFARIPELTQNKLVRLHNLRLLKDDETRRKRMQKDLSLIQGSCGLTILLSEQSDLVSQSLLVRPHSNNLFVETIFVSRRHGRHGILWFLEVLKERSKTLSPLDVL